MEIDQLVVRTIGGAGMLKFLRVALMTVFDRPPTRLIVKLANPNRGRLKRQIPILYGDQEQHFPVLLIGGPLSIPDGTSPHIFARDLFDGLPPTVSVHEDANPDVLVERVVEHIGRRIIGENYAAWSEAFLKARGDGYGPGFYPHDGSIEVGFELRLYDPSQLLIVSLVHYYLGV